MTYYKGYDEGDEADYGGTCEGYFWRVSPEGKVQSIHEDDTKWHPIPYEWDDMGVNAYEVAADLIPARILAAPTSDHAPT